MEYAWFIHSWAVQEIINEGNRKYPRRVCLAIAQFFLKTRYKPGEYLSPEDQKFMEEHIIAYHPRKEQKIGVGISKIKVGHMFQNDAWSVCFFVKRVDGTEEDFSYRKTASKIFNIHKEGNRNLSTFEKGKEHPIIQIRNDDDKVSDNVREARQDADCQVLPSVEIEETPSFLGMQGILIGENGKGYLVKVSGV